MPNLSAKTKYINEKPRALAKTVEKDKPAGDKAKQVEDDDEDEDEARAELKKEPAPENAATKEPAVEKPAEEKAAGAKPAAPLYRKPGRVSVAGARATR